MSEQQKSDDNTEPLMPEQKQSEGDSADTPKVSAEGTKEASALQELKAGDAAEERQLPMPIKADSTELLPPQQLKAAETKLPAHETEWIPGEQLELIRIPPPTIWPATLALGITGIAFGVVTHWILSLAGLFLFLLGAAGWIEDLRKDVLQ